MANITQFGIAGLGDASGTSILQPKMKNKWNVTFSNIAAGQAGGGVDLSVQVVTCTRPIVTHEEVVLDRYNSRSWVAGKHEFEPLTLTFEDDVTGAASQVVHEQLQLQQWLIGSEGPFLATAGEASHYKFAMKINMLDGYQTVIETWALSGCWIKQADYSDLDYSSSEAIKVSLTIRYDLAVQTIGGYAGGKEPNTGAAGVALGGPAS
jgi:hypothetical protein